MDTVNLAVRIIGFPDIFVALITERTGSVSRLDAAEKRVRANHSEGLLMLPGAVAIGAANLPDVAVTTALNDYERRFGY